MSRLLILACSHRKRPDLALLPAIERYDGPTFRVVRRYMRTEPTNPIALLILSARYGLIDQHEPIPDYDETMTDQQAREMAPRVAAQLTDTFTRLSPAQLLFCTSRRYMPALAGYEAVVPPTTTIRSCQGGLGHKLAVLHDWLHGVPPTPAPYPAAPQVRGTAVLRGRPIVGTRHELLARVRRALQAGDPAAVHYCAWYVNVDGHRIPPKWLVAQWSGLPVRMFGTSEARRILVQLGFKVERI